MFIKLHYRDVTALIRLIEDLDNPELDSEELHALRRLKEMEIVMRASKESKELVK